MSPPRLLVVDDHHDILVPLARYLAREGFLVRTAQDASQARSCLAAAPVDLLVLDVMMPGESGLSLCRDLRQRLGLPVILLTAMGETLDRIQGLDSGADDYLVKPFDPAELVARIRAVLRRCRPAEQADASAAAGARGELRQFSFAGWRLDMDRQELLSPDGEPTVLGTAELRLLHALVLRPQQVLSRDELLELTTAAPSEVFDRSIDTQVSRLRKKLEADPRRPQLLKTAWGSGYLLAAEVQAG